MPEKAWIAKLESTSVYRHECEVKYVTYYAKMSVYCGDALVGIWLEKLRPDDFFDGEDDAIFAADAD
jgi:hypothetical protein